MWGILWRGLRVTVPVPLVVILAAGIWFKFDNSSAVRKAITELVAGAELDAREAKTAALQVIIDTYENDRKADERNALDFETELAADTEQNRVTRSMAEVDIPSVCVTTDDIYDRLLNK